MPEGGRSIAEPPTLSRLRWRPRGAAWASGAKHAAWPAAWPAALYQPAGGGLLDGLRFGLLVQAGRLAHQ
jgi:hypothetical protein